MSWATIGDEDPRSLLRQDPLFSALSDAELGRLLERAELRSFADKQILFVEGEPCEGLYIITSGSVRIFKSSALGREILLTLQRGPATVAEVPVFDGGPYPASAQAVGEVSAYHVSKHDFEELCRQNPEVSLKILAVAGSRLRTLVNVVHQVTFGGVRQRLAQWLLDLESENGGSPFLLTQTHQELASSLGSVREVISRNLGRFQAEGLIRIENRQVWIDDRATLEVEAKTELR